ncbi:MAG: hypothetical protein PGN23_17990 [Sphingomonas adhaesiva]|uniref:hypothetical protein n=1 Tax=Sphingomonas adhaesiva TaxID=28212 RepID=UPI002FF70F15
MVKKAGKAHAAKSGGSRSPGASGYVLALREALAAGLEAIGTFEIGDCRVEIAAGDDSMWAVVRRPGGGGIAIRAGHATGGFRRIRKRKAGEGEALHLVAESAAGRHRFSFGGSGDDLRRLRVRAWVTPTAPLLIPFLPRDLYPLDGDDDPMGATGRVEAAQRGPNTGLVYLTVEEPAFGHVLYVQDLTRLNDYFRTTETSPIGRVGGEWPELGYLPPTPPQSGTPPIKPLPAGEETAMSDAIIVLRDLGATSEQEKARQFVQMLGEAYAALDRPPILFRDWVSRAEATLRDLDQAPAATCTSYGHRYIRPYTGAEYPDSMVQMTVLAAIHDFARWSRQPEPLEAAFAAGMERFYDPDLKTLRRYLPNVGEDKNADAVDSWYLYHPLRNLAHLALDGEDWARDLFLRSVDYGIRAAHHFAYDWPIQYDVRDFRVITAKRGDEKHGQTDVGGFYAYVMLLGFELTGETRFVDEARAALDAAMGMRFELEYQANLTAWGAAACMRLWRVTNRAEYREQAYVYLASFLHNCEIWESRIAAAAHYSNFFGTTALHDAPYMAMYECFDSFMAWERFLLESGPELDPAARTLIAEYGKYVLHRAWFYYPDALPADILARDIRNGHIDRALSFPVEDLYADGQAPGQVGQEIYGAGAALVLASRAFHRVDDAPFHIFSDHLLAAQETTGDRAIGLQLTGTRESEALLAIVRRGRRRLPACHVTIGDGEAIRPTYVGHDRIEFRLPGDAHVTLSWNSP